MTPGVVRIRRILDREYPYRVKVKQIRRICTHVPIARKPMRAAFERFVAAVVALPFQLRERSERQQITPPTRRHFSERD